jgi:YD repeat-containing protein
LERITDPLGNKTEFTYDQVGRKTSVTIKRPDGTVDATTTYAYNLLGQMTSETVTINGQNAVRTHSYNHQGLRVSSALNGLLTDKIVFDAEDRPLYVKGSVLDIGNSWCSSPRRKGALARKQASEQYQEPTPFRASQPVRTGT